MNNCMANLRHNAQLLVLQLQQDVLRMDNKSQLPVDMIVDHPEKVVLHLQNRRLSAVFQIHHAIVHACLGVYNKVYW